METYGRDQASHPRLWLLVRLSQEPGISYEDDMWPCFQRLPQYSLPHHHVGQSPCTTLSAQYVQDQRKKRERKGEKGRKREKRDEREVE
jgi:hypothetical protein